MRILLAEDDKNLNHSIAQQLTAKGFAVDCCFDGEEALYFCEQNIHDVILLDRMLPLMDGTAVLKKHRIRHAKRQSNRLKSRRGRLSRKAVCI